ncbi:MAG: hypothetical protein PHD58_02405 [Anaerolineales bacterium]|nr:hypothetical protein [Anaerolineales bacterium]
MAEALLAQSPGLDAPAASSLTLRGESALPLPQAPGQELNRTHPLRVHAGRVCRFSFSSADESLGQVYQDMGALYAAAVASSPETS